MKSKLLKLGIFLDNEYLDNYISIINNNKTTYREKFKTQKHHIIPQAYYRHEKLEVNNQSDNIVNLTYLDHILAHYYLAKCATGWFEYSAVRALTYLISRIDMVKASSNPLQMMQINFTAADLQAYMPDLADVYEQSRKLEARKNSGGKWMNNGYHQRYMRVFEIDQYLADGWKIGKLLKKDAEYYEKIKNRKHIKGKDAHWYHNGNKQQLFCEDEVIPDGWELGVSSDAKTKNSLAHKGRIPGNKGKKGLQGKNRTTWTKGQEAWNKGKKHSDETRLKMSLAAKNRRSNNSKKVYWSELDTVYDSCTDAKLALKANGFSTYYFYDILNKRRIIPGISLDYYSE